MNVSEKDLEALNGLVPNAVPATAEELKNSGKSIVTYGIRKDDKITFFAMEDYEEHDEFIKKRPFGGGAEMLVACKRNNEVSLFSLSDLRRRDINLEGVGKFRKDMITTYEDDLARLKFLAGKTIEAGDIISYDVPKAFVPELDEHGEPTGKNVPLKDEKGNIVPKETKATCPEIILADVKKK
jgi:hypothetical protein